MTNITPVEDNNNTNSTKHDGIYSKRLRAGRRRTYFFDIRQTRSSDYYLTITESKKKFEGDGYERHKIFLYKEDFNKFIEALNDTVDHVKTELLPDYDFDEFNHSDEYYESKKQSYESQTPKEEATSAVEETAEEETLENNDTAEEEIDEEDLKWD